MLRTEASPPSSLPLRDQPRVPPARLADAHLLQEALPDHFSSQLLAPVDFFRKHAARVLTKPQFFSGEACFFFFDHFATKIVQSGEDLQELLGESDN